MPLENFHIDVEAVDITKPHLVFLLHGMGRYVDENGKDNGWADKWIEALNKEAAQYAAFVGKDKPLDDYVTWVPINYDYYFHEYWKDVGEALADLNNVLPIHFPSLAEKLPTAEELTDGTIYKTWLDPVLWRATNVYSAVLSYVRLHLMKNIEKIEQIPEFKGKVQISIIAHSMGTSVIHDALATLPSDFSQHKTYNPSQVTINNLHTLANVSRLLQSSYPVYAHPVTEMQDSSPALSYCANIYHYLNTYDPFTWLRRYNAKTSPVLGDQITISTIDDPNDLMTVHDFTNYIKNPRVHGPILKSLTAKSIKGYQIDDQTKAYETDARLLTKEKVAYSLLDKAEEYEVTDDNQNKALKLLIKLLTNYGPQLIG